MTSAITFRLYAFGASSSTSTFSVNNFTFDGTANSIAGNYLWDANGTTAGAGSQGGNWTDAKWTNDVNGATATGAFTAGNTATFGAGTDGGTYTVSINTAATSAGLKFEEGAVTLAHAAGGSLTLTSPVVDVATGANATIGESITTAVGLTKQGAGTLTLSAANSFTGTTAVTGGTLTLANANAIQNSTLVVSGGAVNFDASVTSNAFAVGNIAGSGGLTLSNNAATPVGIALTVGGNNADATFAGVLGGTGSLIKTGTGTLTLSATNTQTGGLTINGGAVSIADTDYLEGADPVSGFFQTTINNGSSLIFTGSPSATYTHTFVLGAGNEVVNVGSGLSPVLRGIFSGQGALVKEGAGTLNLFPQSNNSPLTYASNAYAGGTTVNNGVLDYYDGGTLQPLGTGTVTINAATLQFYNPNYTNSYTGTLQNNIVLGNAASAVVAGTATGTLYAQSPTFSGTVTGTGTLNKSGAGTLILTNTANSYSGGTLVTQGGLTGTVAGAFGTGNVTINPTGTNSLAGDNVSVASAGSIASTAAVTVNSEAAAADGGFGLGSLTFSGSGNTIGSLTGNGAVVLISTTLTTGNAANTTFSGVVSGASGFLTKAGTGTFTLSGTNTYGGGTSVSAGTLLLGNTSGLGATSATLAVGAGTLDIATFSPTVGALTLTGGTIQSTGSTTAALTATSFGVQSGSVTAVLAGSGGLTKTTSGTVTLFGADTYSGGTTVSAGTLALRNTAALGLNTATLTVGAGTLDINTLSPTVGAVTLSGGTIQSTGSTTAKLTGASYAVQSGVASAILAGSAALTKTTTGTVTLSAANTYTGGSSINAGILNVVGGSLGTAGTLAFGGGTLQYASGNTDDLSARIANSTGAVSIDTGVNSITFASALPSTNTGGLTKAGGGTLVLSNAANAYTGATTINAGTLSINTSTALGDPSGVTTLNGGTLQFTASSNNTSPAARAYAVGASAGTIEVTNSAATYTIFGTITGATGTGTLTKTGPGTVYLDASGNGTTNTYHGLIISAGTAQIFGVADLGSASYATQINDAATLSLSPNSQVVTTTTGRNIVLNGGTDTINVANAVQPTSSLNFTGPVTGVGLLKKTGPGTLTLSGSDSYAGGSIVNAGTLTGSAGAFSTGSLVINPTGTALTSLDAATVNSTNSIDAAAAVTVNTNSATAIGTLRFNGTANTIGSLAGNGSVVLASTSTFSTGGNNATTAFTGVISGTTGSLTKSGTGILTLGGVNTYGGGTTIAAGTVLANNATNSLGSGTTAVNGGVLAGSGATGGNVAVNSGATITAGSGPTPSDSIGTLTTGAQTWAGGGKYAVKFAGAPGGVAAAWDKLAMSTLSVSGTSKFIVALINASGNAFRFVNATEYPIATFSIPITDANQQNTLLNAFQLDVSGVGQSNTTTGLHFDFSADGGALDIVGDGTSSTPEPMTAALVGLGGTAVLGRRRRRTHGPGGSALTRLRRSLSLTR